MKPLMYGYLRVPSDAEDDEIDCIEQQLKCYAATEGFSYAMTFYEYSPGSRAALAELTHELRRAGARHVVVPSLAHLSAHPLLCTLVVESLGERADVRVLCLDAGSGASPWRGRSGVPCWAPCRHTGGAAG